MVELQTMPLRFRVWDDDEGRFGCIPSHQIGIGLALLHGESNQKDDRYIISQDTGLKDKNGKSIYAGDIVESFDATFVVEYHVSSAQYILRSIKTDDCGNTFDSVDGVDETVKIIGNIWANPELLKEMR